MKFYTIGVYNSTEEEYFEKLIDHQIDVFCDIRQRRGVRGSKYAFVNSLRLQSKLRELGIQYGHIPALAPTTEIRDKQKASDLAKGEQKRNRAHLGELFTSMYKEQILDRYDFEPFLAELERSGARRIVLFCVEEKPEACHRSLVTERLSEMGYPVIHL